MNLRIQSVLFQSPYSGCPAFSGWKKPVCPQAPNTQWPSPYKAPGAILCVDRCLRRPSPQNVQQVHFRPTLPYPGYIGQLPPLNPMPSAWTQKVGAPPYNLHALAGPSSTGPYTYQIGSGLPSGGNPENVVGTGSMCSTHNLGLS